jgi:transposase
MPEVERVVSVGCHFLVAGILSKLGAARALEGAVGPRRASEAVAVAAYMASEGNVMEHISAWRDSSMLAGPCPAPQKAPAFFASLSHGERMAFFRQWAPANAKHGYLSYDVTSFSSYAEGISDLEWGYNRDGDRLPQINLGRYLAQGSRLPVFYVTYPGSIVDKSHLPYMMAYNDELGIGGGITFVMDRGFCSASNVDFMHSEGRPYIMGVDKRSKAAQEAIDGVRKKIASLRHMAGDGTYAVAARSKVYGGQASMHVFYSPELAERQRRDLLRVVENMEAELAQAKDAPEKGMKRFARYLDISMRKGGLSFERNYDRIDEASKNCGFFCILTNTEAASAEVLETYRGKDALEKGFDDIKNHIDMKRVRAHSGAAVDGKLFCAFLALIATSEMSNRLRAFNEANKARAVSKRGLISELEKIRVFVAHGGRRFLNPLTKTQRSLLAAFDLGENDLNAYLQKT